MMLLYSSQHTMDTFIFKWWSYILPTEALLAFGAMICFNIDAIRQGLLQITMRHSAPAEGVFLSHDWGTDGLGRSNHERVGQINAALQARGLRTWFDSERMRGDINAAMTQGIDNSYVVVCCVTEAYMKKAAGEGPHGADDNCAAEFAYALNRKGVARIVAAVMEPRCRDTSMWHGVVGLRLGSRLYVDLSHDTHTEEFANGIDKLVVELAAFAPPPSRSSVSDVKHGAPRPAALVRLYTAPGSNELIEEQAAVV